MDKTNGKLRVYFEEPFWVGVFEQISDGKLFVCKVTFRGEPKDYEVWDLVHNQYHELKFSPVVETETKQIPDNSKRRLCNVRKQMKNSGSCSGWMIVQPAKLMERSFRLGFGNC